MAKDLIKMEHDPPSLAIHSTVVGFIMLIFIVARVLTTRGFAALKPGFNTRAIVTWLACTSLTLLVIYNAMLARILYKDSLAGVFVGPTRSIHYFPGQNATPVQFPINITLVDLSDDQSWNLNKSMVTDTQSVYYVLGMKPMSLYSFTDWRFLRGLRTALKLSHGSLLACLLLLNTYWCRHVEALVDEGDFMSKTEMYLYYVLAAISLVSPASIWCGIFYGLNDPDNAELYSSIFLLVLGVAVAIGYTLTCIRLRALEHDSRNVNGDDTSTTLQLMYYVHCVYWLIGSMILILILGVLYKTSLVPTMAETNIVMAQAINDIQGGLWGTLIIMVYPAAMFLLYPSVDVLTQPENDPGSRFQKRVRRSVKDAKRIRESLYLEGDSMNGVDTGHHSSLQGLTTYPSPSNRPTDSGLSQGPQNQRFSFYEPIRRERMGSITAVVNEMQVIVEEDGSGSLEMVPTLGSLSNQSEALSGLKGKSPIDKAGDYHLNDIQVAAVAVIDARGPGNYNDDIKDVEVMKKWLARNGDLDRAGIISESERTIHLDHHMLSQAPTTSQAKGNGTSAHDDLTTLVHSDPAQLTSSPSISNDNDSVVMPKATPSTPKHSVVPLAGILKTRNSSQNPFDQGCNVVSSPNRSSTPTNVSISTYGVRTSSIQGLQRRSSEHAQVKRRASNSSSSKLTLETFASPSPGLSLEPPLLSPTPQQRRSNVTGRVDAGALALAAHQQQQQQSRRSSKSRSSKDGIEVDYFGLRKSSIENIAPTTPPPLPYEPQAQGIQPIELHMSPTMTGFLMADPYPSVGSRYLDDESGQENSLAELSTDSQSDRRGSTGGSKKYKAPPPPIPIEAANAKSTERRMSSVPATPSTPTTPPGVRPARSVDTVMDQQFIEMANQMYHDHVVPVHLTLNTTSVAPLSVILASAAAPEQSVTPAETSVMPSSPTLLQPQQNLSSIMQQEHTESPLQHVMTPPAKSPYRVRESFESRISQGGSSASGPNFQGQGPVTPPSPASTVSPTIASTTTLPRPLTPAWYETKTNFASTNDVLTHYNAVMRGGSHHKREQQHEQQRAQQQQQQQQQPVESAQKQLFYPESAIGPLDDVPQASHMFSQKTNHDHIQPRAYSQQPRMGSADSFGVIRRRSSTGRGDTTQSIVNQQKLSLDERRHNESPQRPQQAPQLGRHSFVMPSETISTYSAWTGDLSDVTTTSGEVSVGAFVDRKHTSSLLQSHQQQDRRRSDEKTSSLSSSLQSGIHHSSDEQEKDRDVRKSQASAYSMGSSFGVGSSSRQSAGAYSNYSSNSGYGSGSIIVSGPLPSAGQPLSNSASGSSPSGSSHSGVSQKHNNGAPKKRSSHNRTDSGSGHGSLTESTGNLGNSSRRITKGAPMAISGKMNSIRLSAFGPGEDDVEISEAGDTQTSQGASVSGREFYLDNSNQQTPQDLERQIQQEWMDRRAAVKKDSKNRLQQLHKQQQEIDEQKKLHDGQGQQHQRQHQHHQDRQQRYLQLQSESCQEDIASEEPYTLNSVYFKSTAEILQLGKVHSSDAPIYPAAEPEATTAYPYPRAESVGMSSSSPSGTATSQGLASSASSMATSAVAEASPPSPNVQLYSSSPSPSSRHYGSIALPTFSTSHGGGTHKQHDYDRDIAPESQSQHDRVAADVDSVHGEPDLLIQTSSSYAVHRQNQPQSQARRSPPPPPTLLHYDSIDSIATVRAHHCYQQSLPSSSSSPQPQRSIPSSPTSPASPTSMSQRQQYAQHRYQQSQQQFHHPQSDQQLHASLTVLGPSQYRIIPNDATSESSVGASGVRGSISPASRTMSPVERASSRMTNLTNPESEYQWESAELNHHRWEMLETPPRND